MSVQQLITDHIDLWTGAVTIKSTSGRGSNGKIELTGIKKLRELILELAVRGKLVPQDPTDEPASVLLEKIAAEKARTIKSSKGKASEQVPGRSVTSPYEVRKGWVLTNLAAITEINPRNKADDTTDASFIPMPLITTSHHGEHGQEVRKWADIKKGYTHFADGDIALAKITPCFENSKAAVFSGLANGIGAGTTELHVARPFGKTLNPIFILLCLKSPRFLSDGEQDMTGTAGQKRVPKEFFANYPLPLPPLAEQHRIVKKVDELMALCDRLEQETTDHLAAHETLVDTLLDTLTQSADTTELADNWARLAAHFDTLFTTEHSIDRLKQTILQLAVMGRLVPQDPSDESASVLLEKIAEEKARLVKEGILSQAKQQPDISPEDMSFPLPIGWKWVRLGSITQKIGSGATPRGGKSVYQRIGIPFLRSQNIWNDGLVVDDIACISEEIHAAMANTHVQAFDLLLNITGASLGRCAIAPANLGQANVSQHVSIIRAIQPMSVSFLHLTMLSPYIQGLVWGRQVGMAREGLSKKVLELFEIPLPPLAEQHRIVQKFDELRVLCDQLSNCFSQASRTRRQLAQALVTEVGTSA